MHRATPSYDLLDANQPRMDRVPAKTGRMLGETGAKVCRIMQGFYVVFLFSAHCTHNCAVAAPGRAEIQSPCKRAGGEKKGPLTATRIIEEKVDDGRWQNGSQVKWGQALSRVGQSESDDGRTEDRDPL